MKKVLPVIFCLLCAVNSAQAKNFRVLIDPAAPVRSKYHLREMGGIAAGENFVIALTSRGWILKADPQGRALWRVAAGCKVVTGPTINNNSLYYACAEGLLISRSLEDGKENWRFKYPDSLASRPGFSPDRLVFQTGSGIVFCLDPADGSPKWISKQAGRHELSMLGASRPLIIGDKVYLGMLDGFMAALKLDDGAVIWKKEVFKVPITSDMDYQPLADEETIYAGSLEGVCALSRVSGKIFWCVKQGLAGDYALDLDNVYALTKDKQLLVIDKITGVVDQKLPLKKSLLEKWEPDKLLWMSKDEQRMILVLAGSVWEWKADAEAPKRAILYPDRTMRAAELQGDRLYLITSKGYLVSRELK